MSLQDILIANLRRFMGVKQIINAVLLCRSKFKNYLSVMVHMKQRKYPLVAKLRNKESIMIKSREEIISFLNNVDYDYKNNIVSLNRKGYSVKLFSAVGNGEWLEIFEKKAYDFLEVKGKIVIDIGANIGDSPIYFALKGAASVVALEPYPKNYQIAKYNIELNNLTSKIILLQAGVGPKDESILVDPSYEGTGQPLKVSASGETVKVISLQSIIENYKIQSAVLKMDCEGCEYDAILSASESTLKRFSRMQIEYHYGYRDICQKLKQIGFEVSVKKPTYQRNEYAKNKHMYVGYIYAEYT
jgi:FkbM family methyltransferase